jgi:hypothetical protein
MHNPAATADVETGTPQIIDGWVVVSHAQVVQRLTERFPEHAPAVVEAIVDRETEAFTGGRPLVVPIGVEEGAAEVLGRGQPA